MTGSRLENDIRAQSDSLQRVWEHQLGAGAPSLQEAAVLLRSASKVLITGMGASLYAAIPLRYALCARGIQADLIEAGELLHYLHPAYSDALIIMVSRSGESIEIARLLSILGKGRKIIGVTNEPASLLAGRADIALHLASLSDEMVAIQTYTGTLLVLHLLVAALDNSWAKSRDEIAACLSNVNPLIVRCLNNRGEWNTFLDEQAPVHLLARGPSTASALEGALLFNEVAKHPAIGMMIASFRHGPVEVVDRGFRGLIFAPVGPTRDLNLALARDIHRFGAGIRLIGPPPDSEDELAWAAIPACPETLAPLFEIIPVQVAALCMAQIRGIPPGSFRYAPQVAADEASFA